MLTLHQCKQRLFLFRLFQIVKGLFLVALLSSGAWSQTSYYWQSAPVGNPATAQLLTLFCLKCGTGTSTGKDIPLVAVLRDTLGETDRASHRLTAVWLLTYSHPTIAQRSLAAATSCCDKCRATDSSMDRTRHHRYACSCQLARIPHQRSGS